MSSETKIIIGMMAVIIIIVGLIIVFDKSSSAQSSEGLKIGKEAPDFKVQDYSGKMIAKSDYQGKNILLYFNEGVGCPPCWQQSASLQADKDKFSALNTEILNVVVDPAESIKSSLETYKITLPVLIDSSKKMSTEYKILDMKSSMHIGQKPGHTFVLIGADNKIKWVGDYPEMNVSDEQILDKVKSSLEG